MATFAQRLIDAKNMLAGLTAHTSELSKRGITPEALAQISQLYQQAAKQDDDRNALRARNQEATLQAEQTMDELEGLCSDARKLVRMELPEVTWPEFGFRKGEFARKEASVTTKSQKTVS
jgi:hypothetical protein